jgi:uncharacterized coiled-coil protein SlyX
MNQDIIQLQETVLHQQNEIQTLSDELFKQQIEIKSLKQMVLNMLNQMKQIYDASFDISSGQNEKPPHY